MEAKKAVPKDETAEERQSSVAPQRTRKVFVGGLAPSVDEAQLRGHFSQFGTVEDAVVMYDHENKRPRGFGFITFAEEDAVDRVFSHGAVQTIADKPIEVKAAVPRDQMPVAPRMQGSYYGPPPPHRGQHYGPPHGPYGPYYGPPGPAYPPQAYGRPYNGRALGAYGEYRPRSPGPAGPRPGPMPNGPPMPQGGPYAAYTPQPQRYGPPPHSAGGPQASAPAPSPGGGQPKVPPMPQAYDMYGGQLNGVNNAAVLSSLYNMAAGLPLPNGLPAAAAAAGVNPKQLNSLNNQLKALNLAAGFAAANFAASQQPDGSYQDDAAAAAAYAAASQEDFAASAAEAMQGLNGLAVGPEAFNSLHEAGFTTAPAPGWSS